MRKLNKMHATWKVMGVFFLFFLSNLSFLNATSSLGEATEKLSKNINKLRILTLLPNLIRPLAVEPMIPQNFVAMSPRGAVDVYDWIYWGPKEVLEHYFKDPDSLKQAVLRVKLTANVAQTGPKEFSGGNLKELEKQFPGFSQDEHQWGSYPVLGMRASVEGKTIFVAWVGLNDPIGRAVLLFNLVYLDEKGLPSEQDRDLWSDFLFKTKQLPEPDFFKAHSQD